MFRKLKPPRGRGVSDYKNKTYDISYLTEDDINENTTITLEKLKNITRYLGSDDVLTYKIYLQLNPHLPNEEKEYYEEYIKIMEHNNNLNINKMLDIYKNNECKE